MYAPGIRQALFIDILHNKKGHLDPFLIPAETGTFLGEDFRHNARTYSTATFTDGEA
jgi:hypothetical protein